MTTAMNLATIYVYSSKGKYCLDITSGTLILQFYGSNSSKFYFFNGLRIFKLKLQFRKLLNKSE